jgi:hypothetical protein
VPPISLLEVEWLKGDQARNAVVTSPVALEMEHPKVQRSLVTYRIVRVVDECGKDED